MQIENSGPIDDGLLYIDQERHETYVKGIPIEFTPIEWHILVGLAKTPYRVISPHQIWGYVSRKLPRVAESQPNMVAKTHISYIRRKIKQASGCQPIETVKFFGYRYNPPNPKHQCCPRCGQPMKGA